MIKILAIGAAALSLMTAPVLADDATETSQVLPLEAGGPAAQGVVASYLTPAVIVPAAIIAAVLSGALLLADDDSSTGSSTTSSTN